MSDTNQHADTIGWLGAAEKFLLDAAPNQEEIPYRSAEACHNAKSIIEAQAAEIAELKAKLATLQGGLQGICDTHGYTVPKPLLNNLLAALEDDDE